MFAPLLVLLAAPNPLLSDVITHRLARAPELAGTHVEVSADGAVVTLSGIVGSKTSHRTAIRVAEETWGVVSVEDDLEIDPDAVEKVARKDHLITQDVTAAFEPVLAPVSIEETWASGRLFFHENWSLEVEVIDGLVRLRGTVGTRDSLCALIHAAHAVPGVKSVEAQVTALDDRWYDPYEYRADYPLRQRSG